MRITPIGKRKIKDQVLEALEDLIARDRLKPGARLPSASELARALAVGSRSIREALAILEARGVVEVKHGKGIFLVSSRIDHYLESLAEALRFDLSRELAILVDLGDVRRFLESGIAHQVATTREPAHIESLRMIVEQMRLAVDQDDNDRYNGLDREFHECLVDATGNRIMITIYRHLRNLLLKAIAKTGYTQRDLASSFQEHERLYELIRDGEAESARTLMERHLAHSAQTLRTVMKESRGE